MLALALLSLTSCRTHWPAAHAGRQAEVVSFPAANLPLPATDFAFLLPEAPALEQAPAPRKEIISSFSARETNHIAVQDPKLFAEGDTEIIDLTLIPEEAYAFPLPGGKVISGYGGRRRGHSGTDIKTHARDTIVAAFDGIVRMAKPYAAYGLVVVIRHYNGLETVYSHNSKNLVKPGDRVRAGQPIGLTGRTGRATTEHLHFEVRINGDHFNPNLVFNLRSRKLRHRCLVCTKRGSNVAIKSVDFFPHQKQGPYHPAS